MLTTLRIKNLALVTDLTLDLAPGYNVLTGETGAGKSILIGALNLVLGERADRTWIRSGSDSCAVEAVFDIRPLRRPLRALLEENGLEPCEGDQLILKRMLSANGTHRQFINGSPTTLQVLATLGEWLVDIHGPHEHQSLLHPARQLELLDAFASLETLREAFAGLVRRRRDLVDRRQSLGVDPATYERQLDLLRHQVREIEAARLRPEEEEALQHDYQRASNAARILETTQAALDQLGEDEAGLLTQAGAVGRALQELKRLDPDAECLLSLQEQAASFLRDLQSDLRHYADRIEIDPDRLRDLEERLNLLQSLKRKYGARIDAVIEFGLRARQQLEQLEGREGELARLEAELQALDAELLQRGRELSRRRREARSGLTQAVAAELEALGFRQSHFAVDMTSKAQGDSPLDAAGVNASGLDTVEFLFAPNPGEPARPLRSIASSGEIARVMLALKTVLAAQDEVPVLVFDEVDANVGGETAQTVGLKMQAISRRRQVLCITHLAPVAASADTHFVVTKETRLLRTVTEVRRLDGPDRVTELARMLGGQSEAARHHAEALLQRTPLPAREARPDPAPRRRTRH